MVSGDWPVKAIVGVHAGRASARRRSAAAGSGDGPIPSPPLLEREIPSPTPRRPRSRRPSSGDDSERRNRPLGAAGPVGRRPSHGGRGAVDGRHARRRPVGPPRIRRPHRGPAGPPRGPCPAPGPAAPTDPRFGRHGPPRPSSVPATRGPGPMRRRARRWRRRRARPARTPRTSRRPRGDQARRPVWRHRATPLVAVYPHTRSVGPGRTLRESTADRRPEAPPSRRPCLDRRPPRRRKSRNAAVLARTECDSTLLGPSRCVRLSTPTLEALRGSPRKFRALESMTLRPHTPLKICMPPYPQSPQARKRPAVETSKRPAA